MRNKELREAVKAARAETKTAIETIFNALNPGQRKQLVKDPDVKALFDLYGVAYDE